MIKKIFGFLNICYLLFSCITQADVLPEPEIIVINNIEIYKDAAKTIIEDAKKKNGDIFDARDKKTKIAVVTKNVPIYVSSELMDRVTELYFQAIADASNNDSIAYKEYDTAVIYIDKSRKIVDTVIIKRQ